jgi:hypothetical protein
LRTSSPSIAAITIVLRIDALRAETRRASNDASLLEYLCVVVILIPRETTAERVFRPFAVVVVVVVVAALLVIDRACIIIRVVNPSVTP